MHGGDAPDLGILLLSRVSRREKAILANSQQTSLLCHSDDRVPNASRPLLRDRRDVDRARGRDGLPEILRRRAAVRVLAEVVGDAGNEGRLAHDRGEHGQDRGALGVADGVEDVSDLVRVLDVDLYGVTRSLLQRDRLV